MRLDMHARIFPDGRSWEQDWSEVAFCIRANHINKLIFTLHITHLLDNISFKSLLPLQKDPNHKTILNFYNKLIYNKYHNIKHEIPKLYIYKNYVSREHYSYINDNSYKSIYNILMNIYICGVPRVNI